MDWRCRLCVWKRCGQGPRKGQGVNSVSPASSTPRRRPWYYPVMRGITCAHQGYSCNVDPADLAVDLVHLEEIGAGIWAAQIAIANPPRPALFAAGKAFRRYRGLGGSATRVRPDFFI